jgi:outer membrane receptor protein involved in Fe transport
VGLRRGWRARRRRPRSRRSRWDHPAPRRDRRPRALAAPVPGGPHGTTQEILNNIPGLVVAQHQGGGKAPQWLIRGFDADHGTDIAVFVDDLPMNLRTHGHGQGYADLNPLIPEVVDSIQLRKGPYFAEYGDFATAGALNFVTKDEFKENFFLAEGGSFDVMRYVAGGSHDFGFLKALVAGQAYFSDGPFDNPQDFSRYNAYTKLSATPSDTSKLWLGMNVYDGSWHGSGQVPLRAVSSGQIDRFGSIDPTEGGGSDREDFDLHWDSDLTPEDKLEFLAYGSRYKLQLFTDFTFWKDTGTRFREDPTGRIFDTDGNDRFVGMDDLPTGRNGFVLGDGIEQNDQRYLYGGRVRYTRAWLDAVLPMESRIAVETRNDDIDVALHRQVRRNRFFSVNDLAVSERSMGTYFTHEIFFTDWIRLEAGLRGDVFFVDGRNRLRDQRADPNFDPVPISGSTSASIVSPKATLVVTPVADTDVYLNFGEGYHSNDARNALTSLQRGQSGLLTKALGYELGARTRQFDRLDLAAALWLLDLDSELVFSGDAGNQETGSAGGVLVPSPSSRRWGIDVESRYQITSWLFADYDLSYADARCTATAADRSIVAGDAVALAPTLLMNGGITAQLTNGFSIALRTRFLDDRPASEDRTFDCPRVHPARPARHVPLAKRRGVAGAPQPHRHRLARSAVLRQLVPARRARSRPRLRPQTGKADRARHGRPERRAFHAGQPVRRSRGAQDTLLTAVAVGYVASSARSTNQYSPMSPIATDATCTSCRFHRRPRLHAIAG